MPHLIVYYSFQIQHLFVLSSFTATVVVSPQQVTGTVGVLQEVECRVTVAQAAANITWILNGTDITSDAHAEIRPNNLNVSFTLYIS